MQDHARLSRLLAFDAVSCLAMGVVLAAASGPLAGLTGLPSGLLLAAGLLLLPVAALMAFAAYRPSPALVVLIVAGNAGWVAASLGLFAFVAPNALGTAFVLGQAAFVAGLTLLEWNASRRAAPQAARA